MSDKKDHVKDPNPPNPPPKKDGAISKDGGKNNAGKVDDSLNWLVDADRYNSPTPPPKKSGDWMKDNGKIV